MASGGQENRKGSALKSTKICKLLGEDIDNFVVFHTFGSGGLWGSLRKSGGKSGEDLGGFGESLARLWEAFEEREEREESEERPTEPPARRPPARPTIP